MNFNMGPKPAFARSARRRFSSRRRLRGFTLVETLLVSLFFVIIMGLIFGINLDTARVGTIIRTSAGLQTQAHGKMDTFVNDIHDSDQILSTYTTASGTVYSSNTQSTLILEAPSYTTAGTIPTTTDSKGNVVPASYDYIVYHTVSASGSKGPYTLNRLVETASGSARSASADTVLASNVQTATFTCLVDQPLNGNGVDTSFGLNSRLDTAGLGMAVTMNGSAVSSGNGASQAQYMSPSATSLGTLDFGTAPLTNAVIDAVYPVDPSNAANGGNVSQVELDLTLSAATLGSGPVTTQTLTVTSSAYLRNQ